MTDQIADARPPTRADLLREQAELWRTDMADGGYVAHGAAKQLADVLQAAIEEVATLRAERDRLQRTVASVAMMLGWGNVPPQDTLERDIAALKARVADATALRARDAQLEQALTAVRTGARRPRGAAPMTRTFKAALEEIAKHEHCGAHEGYCQPLGQIAAAALLATQEPQCDR
jgi:ABC-type transporter Mla subunit MlaD